MSGPDGDTSNASRHKPDGGSGNIVQQSKMFSMAALKGEEMRASAVVPTEKPNRARQRLCDKSTNGREYKKVKHVSAQRQQASSSKLISFEQQQ